MCPQNQFFGLNSDGMDFFEEKNLKTAFGNTFHTEKVIFIFIVGWPVPPKLVMPRKIIFCSYFGKYCFFCCFLIVKWKLFKTSFPTKKVILIFVAKRPLPFKLVVSFLKWFFAVIFWKYCFSFWKTCSIIIFVYPVSNLKLKLLY